MTPDGRKMWRIECQAGNECDRKARKVCKGNYWTVSDGDTFGIYKNMVIKRRKMLITCHRSKVITARSDDQRAAGVIPANRWARSVVMRPNCRKKNKVRKGCGFLADLYTQDEYVQEFVEETCEDNPSEPVTKSCRKRFTRMYASKLARRFWAAEVDDVELFCVEDKQACENLREYEFLLLRHHNERIKTAHGLWVSSAGQGGGPLEKPDDQSHREKQIRRRINSAVKRLLGSKAMGDS